MSEANGIPKHWTTARLDEIALVNPKKTITEIPDVTKVSFVPMQSVQVEFGGIDVSSTRSLREVHRGYTQFRHDDVLFAKITPCMENGKIAVVPELRGGIGYGSTEFHVLRRCRGMLPKWIAFYLVRSGVRRDAQRSMTGSAGQLRVPTTWLKEREIPIAPTNEQRRIVSKIEELFSDLDAGVAALERAKANLKRYRAAVLKAAVEGKLTEQWRAEHPDVEPASELLNRILAKRRQRWEADQLAKYEAKGKKPPKGWKEKYKEPVGPEEEGLPELPEGWCWARIAQLLAESSCNGISVRGTDDPPGIPALRLSAMSDRGFNYYDRRYIPIEQKTAESLAIGAGDFFVSRGNGSLHLVGRGTLAQTPPELIVFPDTMIRLRLSDSVRQFVSAIWPSRFIRDQIEQTARTSAGIYKISQRDTGNFMIPVPPTAEQAEIVSELSRLESVIEATANETQRTLVRSARLRQSILKRAFEGNLVPQDPNDELASELLDRIKAKRASVDANGKRRTKRERKPKAKQ